MAKHIRDYVETGGRQRKGTRPKLLLTTRGRHTGKLRRTALYYWNDGDDYLLVGSDGGSAQHPLWYLNLTAQPEVTVQIGAESFAARARTASQEEKPRLWAIVVADVPMYDGFQRKTKRHIPVVVLTP